MEVLVARASCAARDSAEIMTEAANGAATRIKRAFENILKTLKRRVPPVVVVV